MLKKNICLHTYFKGQWSFSRSATFHNHMPQFTDLELKGRAEFAVLTPTTLLYAERTTSKTKTSPFHDAYQKRLYHVDQRRTDYALISYEDGLIIHELDLAYGYWCFEHFCGQDVYRGAYHLLDEVCFEIQWKVLGPLKSYSLKTLYKR